MTRIRQALRSGAVLLSLVLVAPIAGAQRGSTTRPNRQEMWPAPTAEDWKRPCLITWQRTYQDAQVVSRETGRPILVCVNMDNEPASEHYAGIRYRQPEIAALYEPYVTVIASVYRHNPRDYDEQGRRILCPRFGSVTCGEHIAIEPGLHDSYFEAQRVAPRHIGVELDGKETFDVFYAWDTDTIFNALRKGIADHQGEMLDPARGDRPLPERVASRDNRDRTAVEIAYEQGDLSARRSLLDAALAQGEAAPVELLRLALRGPDAELKPVARRALAKSTDEGAVGVLAEALRLPMETSEREVLIAALARLGATSPRARTLAIVHQGLSARSTAVDEGRWAKAVQAGSGSPPPQIERSALETQLASRSEASMDRPDDAAARLELAESTLALAVELRGSPKRADLETSRKYAPLMLHDARRVALEAEELGATGWRVNSAVAVAAFYLGDMDEAYARAEAAVGSIPADEAHRWNSMVVLALFAESRQQAIQRAVREKKDWPGQWLADAEAAYAVLAEHPFGTDLQVAAHCDLLYWLVGAGGQTAQVLDAGLARFPDSAALHARLRSRLLDEKGVQGLEAGYETMLRALDARPNLEWFAGYASIVAAEFHRRAGHDADALPAYDRAIAHFERAIESNPDSRATADHYIALAMAGRARLAFQREDFEQAVSELVAAFERKPTAAGSEDGLGRTPISTARLVLSRLTELKREELAATLAAAVAKLDPDVSAMAPSFEEMERAGPSPDGRAARRRGGQTDR